MTCDKQEARKMGKINETEAVTQLEMRFKRIIRDIKNGFIVADQVMVHVFDKNIAVKDGRAYLDMKYIHDFAVSPEDAEEACDIDGKGLFVNEECTHVRADVYANLLTKEL